MSLDFGLSTDLFSGPLIGAVEIVYLVFLGDNGLVYAGLAGLVSFEAGFTSFAAGLASFLVATGADAGFSFVGCTFEELAPLLG